MLNFGLYEQVINNALNSELSEIPEARKAIAPIDKAEASKVLAQYLADVVQKGLDNVLDNGIIETYHILSVADYYDLVGVECNYTDNNYGWDDIRSAHIQAVSNGYIIVLPKASPI